MSAETMTHSATSDVVKKTVAQGSPPICFKELGSQKPAEIKPQAQAISEVDQASMEKLASSTERFRRLNESDKEFTQRESSDTELQAKADALPQRLALQVDDFLLKEHPESQISPPVEAVCSVSAITSHHLALSLTATGPLVNNIQPKSPPSLSAVQTDTTIAMGPVSVSPPLPPKTSSLSLDPPPLSEASIDPKEVSEVQLETIVSARSDPPDRPKHTVEDVETGEELAVVPMVDGSKEVVVTSLLTPASLDDVDEEDRPLTVDLSTTVEPITDEESPQKKLQLDMVDAQKSLSQSPLSAKPPASTLASPDATSTTSPKVTAADIVPVSARNGSTPGTTSGKSKEKTEGSGTYASPRPQKPIRPLVARQPNFHQIRVNSHDHNSSDAANRRAFASDLLPANTADMLTSTPAVLPSNGIPIRPGEAKFSASSPTATAVHSQSGANATAATFSSCLPLPSLCQFLPNNSTLTIRLQAPPFALHHPPSLAASACPPGAGTIGGPTQLPGQSATQYHHQPPPPQFFAQPPNNQPHNPTTVQLLPFMAAAGATAGPGGPFSHPVNSPRPPPPFHLFNMAAPPHILSTSGVLVQPPGGPSSGFHITPMSSLGPNGARSLFTPVSMSAFPPGLTSIPSGPQLLPPPPGAATSFGLSSAARLPNIPPPPPLVPAPELSQVFSLPTAMTTTTTVAAPNDNSNYLHASNIPFSSSQARVSGSSADPLPPPPPVSLGTGALTLQADMPVGAGSSASDHATSTSSNCENSQVVVSLPTVTTSFSSSQLNAACPFVKQPMTSTFSELGLCATNIQVPSSICSGVGSGTDCSGVLVQPPPPPPFSARPGFPVTTSQPPYKSELGGSIPTNIGQPPPFDPWYPLPEPPPLVGAPIPNSIGPDDSVCFNPCSSLSLDGGLAPSMVLVSRQSEMPLPTTSSQPVSVNQSINSTGTALNRGSANTATVISIGRRWRPSMRHNTNSNVPMPVTSVSLDTPRTISTLVSQPSTCSTTNQLCVEPVTLNASLKSSAGNHCRPLLSVADVDCRLPKLPKTASCSDTDSMTAAATRVAFAVAKQCQSSPKPFRALKKSQLTAQPPPPHSSATLPLSCPPEQSVPSLSCSVTAASISPPKPLEPATPSISQAAPTSPAGCPSSTLSSPGNVPVSLPPPRPLPTALPHKTSTTTCLQDRRHSPTSSSSPPPHISPSCHPMTAVSSAAAPAAASVDLRGDPASPQPQRRIITHLIDGHVLYESNMPFPVRNAMAVVEAALRQMDIKPTATNRPTSVSAEAKLSSSPPSNCRRTVTGGGDFPSSPARHRSQRSQERTPPSPRPEGAAFAASAVSTIEATNQRKRRSTAPTRLSTADELPTNPGAAVVDRSSVGVTVSADELGQRPLDGRVADGGERKPKRQAETSSALTKAKSPASLQSLPLSSPLMTTGPAPLSVSVPSAAVGGLRSPFPPSSVPEELRTKPPPLLASSVQTAGLKLTIHSVYDSTHANNKERRCSGATNKSDVPHLLPSPITQESGRLPTRLPGAFTSGGGGGSTVTTSLRPPAPSAPPPPGRIRNWSVTDVAGFVTSTPGCAPYADAFLNNEIDGEALLLLAENQFIQPPISMKIGPALKLAARLETLRTNSAYS